MNLCGYVETEPSHQIVDDVNIDIIPIEAIKNTNNLPFIVFAILKVLKQCGKIWSILWDTRGSDYIMIQNPQYSHTIDCDVVQDNFQSRNQVNY